MKTIKNPINQAVQITYGPDGHGKVYKIEAGAMMAFPKELYPVADYFKSIYDFLEVTEQAEPKKNTNPLACQYCGFVAKSKLGLLSHERACGQKPKEEVKVTTPTIESRVANEVKNFGNIDGLGVGVVKQELIGNRVQTVTQDREGVSWYGPGLQADFIPAQIHKNSPGQF